MKEKQPTLLKRFVNDIQIIIIYLYYLHSHVVGSGKLNIVIDHFVEQLIVIVFQLLPLDHFTLFADPCADLTKQRLDVVQFFHVVRVQGFRGSFYTHLSGPRRVVRRFVQPQEHHGRLRIVRLYKYNI